MTTHTLGVAFFGHWGPDTQGHKLSQAPNGPWTDMELDGLPGTHVPADQQLQFKCKTYERKVGDALWLALDFWDRTGDSRHGSHSVIICELDPKLERMNITPNEPRMNWDIRMRFAQAFPYLWKRWVKAKVQGQERHYQLLLTDPR
jgi:hypothetical protein